LSFLASAIALDLAPITAAPVALSCGLHSMIIWAAVSALREKLPARLAEFPPAASYSFYSVRGTTGAPEYNVD
jgi:hypothetical protein